MDFYCAKALLVVEVGGGHYYQEEQINYDKIRTDTLSAFGLAVVRFKNLDVRNNFSMNSPAPDLSSSRRYHQKGLML